MNIESKFLIEYVGGYYHLDATHLEWNKLSIEERFFFSLNTKSIEAEYTAHVDVQYNHYGEIEYLDAELLAISIENRILFNEHFSKYFKDITNEAIKDYIQYKIDNGEEI